MRATVLVAASVLGVLLALTAGLHVALHLGLIGDSPLGGDIGDARSDRPGVRVLFVGNSLTEKNGMPGLLQRLVASDPSNRPIYPVRYSPGGYTLAQHAGNHTVSGLLGSVRWDDVVLQENSNITSLDPSSRAFYMDEPARTLVESIRAVGAQPLLFLTFAYRTGTAPDRFASFSEMQDRIDENYRDVADALTTPIAPAGLAWAEALRQRPGIALWNADGIHPSRAGAYLDACVFYALLYNRSPASSFDGGLAPEEAAFLQRVAGRVVTTAPHW